MSRDDGNTTWRDVRFRTRRPMRLVPALFLTMLALAAPARAADDVYVRAGVGFDRSGDARFTDADCSRNGLYGCGTGSDGAPYSAFGDFGLIAGIELGVGRRVAPSLRIEGVVQIRPRAGYEGRANFLAPDLRQSVSANLSAVSGLAAMYADLPRLGPVRPFAGGGAGVSRIALDETTMTFPRTMTRVPAGRRSGFAWMLSAGVGLPLGSAATLDLAWRYQASGRVVTGAGTGRVFLHDGSIHYRNGRPNAFPLDETWTRLASHGLQVSLRYAF